MYGKRFITLLVILTVAILSNIYFLRQSNNFIINFLAIGVLLVLAVIAFAGIDLNARWGWGSFTLLFTFNLAYLLYVFYNGQFFKFTWPKYLFMINIIISLFGFIVSVLSNHEEDDLDFDDEVEEVKETKSETKESPKVEIVKDFTPAKFLGTKTGNKYHIPKCDWAKKIKKEKQIWFDSDADAKKKGYSKHSCVK